MISIVSCHSQCFDNGQLSLPCLLKKKKKRKKKMLIISGSLKRPLLYYIMLISQFVPTLDNPRGVPNVQYILTLPYFL